MYCRILFVLFRHSVMYAWLSLLVPVAVATVMMLLKICVFRYFSFFAHRFKLNDGDPYEREWESRENFTLRQQSIWKFHISLMEKNTIVRYTRSFDTLNSRICYFFSNLLRLRGEEFINFGVDATAFFFLFGSKLLTFFSSPPNFLRLPGDDGVHDGEELYYFPTKVNLTIFSSHRPPFERWTANRIG